MTRLTRSVVLDASVEQLWPLLRGFGGWGSWHGALAACRAEADTPDAVGACRILDLHDGARVREQLIALSDRNRVCTWCLVEASVPCDLYVISLRLRAVTHEDRSFLQFSASFEAPTTRRQSMTRFVGETLIDAGLAGLGQRFRIVPVQADASPSHHLPLRDKVDRAPNETIERGLGAKSPLIRRFAPPSPARGEGVRPAPVQPQGPALEALAVLVERHGGPEVLVPRRLAVSPPGPGEVRLRHTAIGVNMIDVHGRAGDFGLGTLPAVPGMEATGIVLDVGADVGHLRPGDRVVYAGRPPGAYADLRTMPANIVVRLPADVDERTAAASFLKGLTADLLLHDVHPLRGGELALVHAAAGGLGLLLCAWAQMLGATVVGVVSNDRKVDAAASAGCAAVIVSSREDVADTVRVLTRGRGVDVVFDAVGRATFEASLASLAPRGHLVSFGQVSGPVGARDIDALAARSIRLSRPNFADYTDSPEILAARAERLFGVLRSGQVRPVIDSEWPLSRAADAHRRLESRETVGSVLLRPDPSSA